jgi:general secretion pathway protein H
MKDERRLLRTLPKRYRGSILRAEYPRFAAFSLLELLAVLAIMGVLATMALLSVSTAGNDQLLREEARRLAALVDLNCEEAVMRGQSLALSFGPGGTDYGFLRQAGEEWLPRRADAWRPRSLPEGFRARLTVEGRDVALDETTAGRPHVICLASGELVPFEARLSAPGTSAEWGVTGEWDGDVAVEHMEEA